MIIEFPRNAPSQSAQATRIFELEQGIQAALHHLEMADQKLQGSTNDMRPVAAGYAVRAALRVLITVA